MTLSRGELKGQIWRFLNKSPSQPGYYTSAKLDDAIKEALDFVSIEMFIGKSNGFLTKYIFLDTVAGQTSIDIPGDVALVRDVRYKISDVYYSMPYDDQAGGFSYIGTGVQQAFSYRFRILGRQIVFDPPVSEGGERYLQLEVVYYPSVILDDKELVDPQFDAACTHYIKYKACSILAASIEKNIITWAEQEAGYYGKMLQVVNRRLLMSTSLGEFL